jgi:DNA recombination protein RmuC
MQMNESTFYILFAILALIIVYFFNENRQLKKKIIDSEGRLQHQANIAEESRVMAAAMEARQRSLEEQLQQEKDAHSQKQQELKEQLELMGKDLVRQGASVLKTENEEKLNAILEPLKERINAFEKEVREANRLGTERHVSMEAVIKTLSDQHTKMNTTAQNLVDALRGEQKVQGDWGELALERILEASGLEKNREYFVQNSFKDAEGNNLRPDVIIQLPENKQIIVDSKVSLKAFEQFVNEEDEQKRKGFLQQHIQSVKTHIKQLSEKDYTQIPEITSPDFVLLFIPLESSFALAMKEEPTLYQQAWDRKIVIVTPSTLLATLKTVGSIWKQELQTRNAKEIAEQAGRLYDKFVGFVSDMEKIGNKQREAANAYDSAMNKLHTGNGNLIRSAEKLKKLGVKSGKEIDQKYLNNLDEQGEDTSED